MEMLGAIPYYQFSLFQGIENAFIRWIILGLNCSFHLQQQVLSKSLFMTHKMKDMFAIYLNRK